MENKESLDCAAYTEHLVGVNESKQVIATEDIYNNQGAKIVSKGSPITHSVAQQILRFKLTKPLHDSIEIENKLSGDELFVHFQKLLKALPSFQKINDVYLMDPIVQAECHFIYQYPLLQQKLTVLSVQLPKLFAQTIVTTWLSVLIARKMDLDAEGIRATFIAALAHDLGMLHISTEITSKTSRLTNDEWKHIQAHSLVSYEIMKCVKNLPEGAARAVLEHHEQSDGTGYPKGLAKDSLSLIGQIIALSDSVIAIYTNRLIPNKRSLRDVMPIIQISSASHLYETYDALITILRNAHLPDQGVISSAQMISFIDDLLHQNKKLNDSINAYDHLLKTLPKLSQDRTCNQAHALYSSLSLAIRGSGILNAGYVRWLDQVREETLVFAGREVEDVFLMMEEAEFQLGKLRRLIANYQVAIDCSEKDKETIATCFCTLEEIDKRQEASAMEFTL
ncbi:MAG: hypothetical protein COA99_04480 [Moraxellaceae bacterium]|nr:MAG: hypothetical protein COA99_04480 [Moraxellaceae bacterium]